MTTSSKRVWVSRRSLLIIAAAFAAGWIGAAALVWSALRPEPYRTYQYPTNLHKTLGLSADGSTYLVESPGFSPDNGQQNAVRVSFRDAATGEERAAIEDFSWAIREFSPDHRFLVGKAWNGALSQLWNTADGTEYAAFLGAILCFSDDGRWLAVNDPKQRSVQIWDIAQRQEKFRIPCNVPVSFPSLGMFGRECRNLVSNHCCFSPNGKLVAIADGPAIQLWEVADGRKAAQLAGHRDPVAMLAFSPDGRTLASLATAGSMSATPEKEGEDPTVNGELRFWETGNGKPMAAVQLREINHMYFLYGYPMMHFHPWGEDLVIGQYHSYRLDELMKARTLKVAEGNGLPSNLTQPGAANLSRAGPEPSCEIYNPNGNFVVRYDEAAATIEVRDRAGESWVVKSEVGPPESMGIFPDGNTLFIASNAYLQEPPSRPVAWIREMLQRMGVMNPASEAPYQLELWDLPSRKQIAVLPLRTDFYLGGKRLLAGTLPTTKFLGSAGIGGNGTFVPTGTPPARVFADEAILWDIPPGKPWKPIVLISTVFATLAATSVWLLLRILGRRRASEPKTAGAAAISG